MQYRTLPLNFASGVNPGGGFLVGARAQEETLCRSSALFATLEGDPMYLAPHERSDDAASDSAILSPDVRFFRDDGTVLGAWGCGAFGNVPDRTARDFRDALAGPFRIAFREVVFAIAAWWPDRRFLGPFRDEFAVLGTINTREGP